MKRRDFYGRPHKALRAMMADTLVALGRMDAADDCDVRDTLARLEELLAFCERHLGHENEFVHRAIEERREGASLGLAADHVEHVGAIAELRGLAARRDPSLYRRVALFVGENLVHMEREESEGHALLWELFTDAEIEAIERRLVASMPPDQAMHVLRWMLPAITPAERATFFDGLRNAPPALREGVLAIARTHLRAPDLAKLERSTAQREPATLAS